MFEGMKKLILIFALVCWIPLFAEDETEPVDYGSMFQWETYYSYYSVTQIIKTSNSLFCLSNGAIFSMDIETKELTRWNKMRGLNGGKITQMLYAEDLDIVLVVYENNMLDVIDKNGNIEPIRDLYQTTSKAINIQCGYVYKTTAYLGTDFGIIAINLKKREVADTYYIGDQAKDVSVSDIAVADDTVFAYAPDQLYKASLQSNLLSYTTWETEMLPSGQWSNFISYKNKIWGIQDSALYIRQKGQWENIPTSERWIRLRTQNDKLFVMNKKNDLYEVSVDQTFKLLFSKYSAMDAAYDALHHIYWLAIYGIGLGELNASSLTYTNTYLPDGPINNNIYSLHFAGAKLFICPGYRWGDRNWIGSSFSYYKDGRWGYESDWHTEDVLGHPVYDLVSVGVDPNDDSHFFMSSYGEGVIEYRKNAIYKQYTEGTPGCSLHSLVEHKDQYVRTDGALIDHLGYLWVIQPEARPNTINIMNMNTGEWKGFNISSGGQRITPATPKGIWIDQRSEQQKWFISQRSGAGICLIDDNGTPTNSNDDRVMFRTKMQDQNGNDISFTLLYDWAQDKNDDIWIGLEGGVIIIPSTSDFMTSNQCQRIIIPRNDGTGLADYLLANDNVRAIAIDGGNRKWLGTESSGVYLVSADGMTTIHHFTEENSPLPSNNITDIAIHPITGEVFIGTSAGLIGYRSDASEPFEDYSNIIAYPNPIRPNYDGVVTISGLTDGTIVNIIDQGGQLVCKTNANGGTAVWDLCNGDGRRVSSGIYTALCNDLNGKHQLVKIMVMNR